MRLWRVLRFLILIPVLAGLDGARPQRAQNLDYGIWYWHTPFLLNETDRTLLTSMGVKTLYVRAATFKESSQGIEAASPIEWRSPSGEFDVVLVFNFDYGLARSFDKMEPRSLQSSLNSAVARECSRAKAAGQNVTGVQFDVDCPTRLVPKLADILQAVRSGLVRNKCLTGNDSFSATALPTWFTSKGVRKLAQSVDFLVPQFYEGRPFKTRAEFKPIGDLKTLNWTLERLSAGHVPFRAGLPAYGHALVFQPGGSVAAMYRGLGVGDALRHLNLEPVDAYPSDANGQRAKSPAESIGEDIVELRSLGGDRNRTAAGFTLLYDVPTPEMVSKHLALIKRRAPESCRGVILFRFPEPGESLALPLESVAAVLKGAEPQARFSAAIGKVTNEFTYPLSPKLEPVPCGGEFTLIIENAGNASSFANRGAVEATVSWAGSTLFEVWPGDFDSAWAGIWTRDGGFSSSPFRRANAARFSRAFVLPGERLTLGPIAMDSPMPSEIRVLLRVQTAGGFETLTSESVLRLDNQE